MSTQVNTSLLSLEDRKSNPHLKKQKNPSMKIKHVSGLLAAIVLATGITSLKAQPTNFVAYNFDTDQVTATPYGSSWGNFFGGDFVSVVFDPTSDASNNPASGCLELTINAQGFDQYVLLDGFYPATPANGGTWYGPLDLTIFTNLSFDIRMDPSSAIRTNTGAAGVNGSQGVGSLDFGYMRIGSISPAPNSFGQDWYYNFAIPATNGLGNPNTNWIHMNINLSTTAALLGDLSGTGIQNFMLAMDGGNFGNNVLVGQQIIFLDNITFSGFVGTPPGPRMSISKPTPALRLFGGSGQFGRSQITLQDGFESWIGGPFPISYSFTLLGNATNFQTSLDTHIHFLPGAGNYSGSDFTIANALWLQILSTSSNVCTAQVQWKTNHPNANPGQDPGTTALLITNSVRAGTWTLTFLSDTNGTLTAPGAAPVPFNLGTLADADATALFSSPIQLRFGIQNNNNAGNGGIPDDWANISISGTAGLSGTNYTEDFTHEGTNQLDTTFWNLNTADGAGVIVLVPTNAPYWITWPQPDNNYFFTTTTNLKGGLASWVRPEFYNSYTDGSNSVGTLTTQAKVRWNLMLPSYLPTADGSQGTNFVPGGPLSPTAFFRLQTNPPAQ